MCCCESGIYQDQSQAGTGPGVDGKANILTEKRMLNYMSDSDNDDYNCWHIGTVSD